MADLDYSDLSVTDLREKLAGRDLSADDRDALLAYERQHRNRKTAKDAIRNA